MTAERELSLAARTVRTIVETHAPNMRMVDALGERERERRERIWTGNQNKNWTGEQDKKWTGEQDKNWTGEQQELNRRTTTTEQENRTRTEQDKTRTDKENRKDLNRLSYIQILKHSNQGGAQFELVMPFSGIT